MTMTQKPSSPLLPIFLIVFVDVLGLTIVLPLLPFYTEKYGGSPSVYGFLAAAYAICQLVSGPILGQISDRVGRRPLLIVSQIGTFVGFLVLGFSRSLWMIFLSRIIDGATAGNLSLAQAYISDVTSPQNRAKALGIIGIAFGVGFPVGTSISGFLSKYGYSYPAWAAAFLSFTSIMATTFLLPKEPPPQAKAIEGAPPTPRTSILHPRKYAKFFKIPNLRALLLEFFLFGFGFSAFISGFALFAERRFTLGGHPFGVRVVGFVYAFSGILGVIIQGGLLGRLVKKFGEASLIRIGFFTMALGYGLLGVVSTIPGLLFVVAIGSFGTGLLRPAITSLVTQNAPAHEQGLILGLNQSLMSIAQILAPIFAGILINDNMLAGWALMAAFSGAVGLVLSLRKPKTDSSKIAPQVVEKY
jgi:DHA1 family tetracycline resistance protein-like MFS transporter